MDTLVKADIFFFVTTIAVAVWALVWAAVGYYLIRALRQFDRTAAKVEANIEDTSDEVKEMVADVRQSFLYRLLFKNRKRST